MHSSMACFLRTIDYSSNVFILWHLAVNSFISICRILAHVNLLQIFVYSIIDSKKKKKKTTQFSITKKMLLLMILYKAPKAQQV